MLLASCGGKAVSIYTQSGANEDAQEQTPVELTAEEEEIINKLLEEVTEEVGEEISEPDTDDAENAIDLSVASFTWNGTEPFWGFSASWSTLVLTELSDSGPMDITTFSGVVMTHSGTSVNMTSSWMTLNLMLETCSDGMSDLVYTYSSSFIAGATNYTWCANIED